MIWIADFFVSFVLGVFWRGFVGSKLWLWFMVPVGIPSIGLFHFAGIALVADMILGLRGIDLDQDGATAKARIITRWVLTAMYPGLGLLFGALYQAQM